MLSSTKGFRVFATLRGCLALVRDSWGLFALALGAGLLGALLTGVGDPLALKFLIDSLAERDTRFFLLLAGLLLVLYTSFRVLDFFANLAVRRLKNRVLERLVDRMLGRFYELPYRHVMKSDRGYFISRIYDEPAKLVQSVDLLVGLAQSVVVAVGAIVVCLVLSWKAALLLAVVVPILFGLAHRYGQRIQKTSLEETEDEARLRDGLGRSVDSFKTVRIFGLESHVVGTVDRLAQRLLGSTYERLKTSAVFQMLSGTFLSYAEMAVLIGAGFLVLRGALTVGGLFGFMTAYWRVVSSVRGLSNLLPALAKMSAQLERLDDFEQLGRTRSAAETAGDRIELGRIGFAYDEHRELFSDLTLSIRAGDRLLIEGPNGCGKSTLAHVVCGFLEVSRGEARLPGLKRISALLWPFGFVPGTMRDNLAYPRLSPQRQRTAMELLEKFSLDRYLDRDPVSLSEGQKRKLQVIMTLSKDADFYVFDEPLSNVDVASRKDVFEAILDATNGRGLVVIQHGESHWKSRFDHVVDMTSPSGAEWTEREAS